jgi:hypothetical protein
VLRFPDTYLWQGMGYTGNVVARLLVIYDTTLLNMTIVARLLDIHERFIKIHNYITTNIYNPDFINCWDFFQKKGIIKKCMPDNISLLCLSLF